MPQVEGRVRIACHTTSLLLDAVDLETKPVEAIHEVARACDALTDD